MSGTPTAKQREAWETADRLGSQTAAGKALGISQGHVRAHLLGYAKASGIPVAEIPGAGQYSGRSFAAALYPLIDRILKRQDKIDARLTAIDAKLDQLLARPISAVVPFQPTNRRKVDGGQGGRRERKLGRSA